MSPPPRCGVLLLACALASSACLPDVVIKRSALAPAPAGPAMTGRPLEKGEIKLSGGFNPMMLGPARLTTFVPRVGDPGLLIPTAQLTGSLWYGASDGWEVGGHVHWAPYDWAAPTSDGVFDLPEGARQASTTAGLGARWHRPLAGPFWVAISAELNLANVPEAVYVRCGCASGFWTLDHTEDNLFALPNVFVHLGGNLGGHLTATLFAGLEPGLTNVGFETDPETLGDSTVSTYALDVVGAGIEARLGGLRAELNVLLPIADETSDLFFGPELVLRLSAVP